MGHRTATASSSRVCVRAAPRRSPRLPRPRNALPPRFSWHSIRLCHVAAVPVVLHTTSLLYPVGYLLWLVFGTDLARHVRGGRAACALLLGGFLALAWLCLLVHEFAHVLAARRIGIGTERVVILPFGAAALLEEPLRDKREFWIALAGPAASFALAALFWTAERWISSAPGHRVSGAVLSLVEAGCAINLALACFNLLPCFPMDGGRMLRSILTLAFDFFLPSSKSCGVVLATRTVVWFVNPLIATVAVALTIVRTHLWMHLVMFPLLLIAAEVERRAVEQDATPRRHRGRIA